MILLGIDTSSLHGSVAVVNDESVLVEFRVEPPKSFSQKLFESVDRLLAESGIALSQVDAFAVTTGPGSFTGLRVGLSSVLGFGLGLGKPMVGVPTLDAYARVFPRIDSDICPVLDARKQEIFTALYRYTGDVLEKIGKERALHPESLGEMLSRHTLLYGDGVDRYGDLWSGSIGETVSILDSPVSTVAAQAAILGYQKLQIAGGEDPESIRLSYIRKSEAEIKMAS